MIDCEHLGFSYDGEHFVLSDIGLYIGQGEFVCILGGNGSGKSTFAKHMNALLIADEGTMRIDGMDASDDEALYAIRSTAGMVFQNPDDQLVASIVEDDVAFGPENLGVETPEIARRVREALAEVGLVGFELHETNALSGGQKQRVAIAGALAMEPKILILDEASAMLDPRGRRGLMRVCKTLNARGMTIVCITHFMEEAAQADRVIVLDRGRIACDGTPDAVLTRTGMLAKLNLETPFACTLSQRLRDEGIDIPVCIREDELARAIADAAQCPACEGRADFAEDACEETAEAVHGSTESASAKRGGASAETDGGTQRSTGENRMPVISFEHVSHTYLDASKAKKNRASKRKKTAKWGNDPHAVWALHDIDLAVYAGEFLGIAGHTGSGKSTLIAHMNGILKPTSGRVLVDGRDIADKKAADEARAHVGVVFQYPERQLFAATVYDDVAFGPRNIGLSEDEVETRVASSLSLVGLDCDELRESSPFELSGGQQRRVAFAGVLAMEPRVLVLDEPAAGLDPAARREFLSLVSSLQKETDMTVVMVSHSMDDLAALCDRIVVLKEGALFAEGTPREVFALGDKLDAVGLGLPAARRMALALAAQGLPDVFSTLYSEDELVAAIVSACQCDADGAQSAKEASGR
ncbi:MAG: energy-coupling factor transporter ATPase [Slackia sp.]|nr:energy-coupling factor transporter ATPase [Slackia sp.]